MKKGYRPPVCIRHSALGKPCNKRSFAKKGRRKKSGKRKIGSPFRHQNFGKGGTAVGKRGTNGGSLERKFKKRNVITKQG